MESVLDFEFHETPSGIGSLGSPSTAPYVALTGAFVALAALASRRPDPSGERAGIRDLVALALASHDIARIVARDRITVFLRAPFASGEAAQLPKGSGIRRAVGELVTCPHCLSLWAAAGLRTGRRAFPRQARFLTSVFAAHALGAVFGSAVERLAQR